MDIDKGWLKTWKKCGTNCTV